MRFRPRRFNVSFAIDKRFGKASKYTLMEIAKCVLEPYSISEKEFDEIVQLKVQETWFNEDVRITRLS